MSSIIGVEGGSGTDLSSLTSGERFLIGWLNNPIRLYGLFDLREGIVLGGYYRSSGSSSTNHVQGTLDFTTMDTITFCVQGYVSDGGGQPNVKCYLGATIAGSVAFTDNEEYIMELSGVAADRRQGMHFRLYPSMSGVQCSAFTTVDGKVHTASNLNY